MITSICVVSTATISPCLQIARLDREAGFGTEVGKSEPWVVTLSVLRGEGAESPRASEDSGANVAPVLSEETHVVELRAEHRLRIGPEPLVQDSRVDVAEVDLELHIAGTVQIVERRLLTVESAVYGIADHK